MSEVPLYDSQRGMVFEKRCGHVDSFSVPTALQRLLMLVRDILAISRGGGGNRRKVDITLPGKRDFKLP